ncbi:hypothetical protein ES332_A06G095500v1 [Gossypium tomentosum]|uniref:Uncharacterized protein n=1 Tax=Gossypium tomentosum TaxID=34277 RepID=A0A5D2Q1Q1_GOSTO|nr:hypothetical protein ES332_A06G095500v1 [Gossypium tomentosum]
MFISAWDKLFVICHYFSSIIVGFIESPTFFNSNVLYVMVGSFSFLTMRERERIRVGEEGWQRDGDVRGKELE